MERERVVVIGFDSRRAGLAEPPGAIVEALRGRMPEGVELHVVAGGAPDLAADWSGYDTVIVADRLAPAGSPGAVRVWDATDLSEESEAQFRRMNESALGGAIDSGRADGSLPAHLLVVGVEGRPGGCGVGVCPEVADGLRDAADWVLMQLAVRLAA